MPDYRRLLEFLAKNPPQFESERAMHASLLELVASCLRSDTAMLETARVPGSPADSADDIETEHTRWVNFS